MVSGRKMWYVAGIHNCSGNYGPHQEKYEVKPNIASGREISQVPEKENRFSESCTSEM